MDGGDSSGNKEPKFTGKNYLIWKVWMCIFLQNLGSKVWSAIENEYKPPMVESTTTAGQLVEKTRS